MNDPIIRKIRQVVHVTLCMALGSAACVIEKIDAIIAEHGVTYWPSSGDDSGQLDTSTSTGTSSSGSSNSEADGHSDTVGSSTTDEAGTRGGSERSSTGASKPVCGDGVLQGEETCDDGNTTPDDGCQACAKDSIVFITSEAYKGYALDGLDGADQRCRSLAAKAKLPRSETFRAWLGIPTMAAAERLLHARGRYILTNGLVVAHDWEALVSGTLQNSITVDENSQTREGYVWTGTLPDGQPALGSEFCGEWKETMGFLIFGGEGRALATDSKWSFFGQGDCGTNNSLYCLEQ